MVGVRDPQDRDAAALRFAHFMIRVSRPVAEDDAMRGLVERLGTGEKERFETAAELVKLLANWPGEAD